MKFGRLISGVFATLLFTIVAAMPDDLVSDFRKERDRNHTPSFDATHLLDQYIALGVDAQRAKKILQQNGFATQEREHRDGSVV
jgi:hypothetical protein